MNEDSHKIRHHRPLSEMEKRLPPEIIDQIVGEALFICDRKTGSKLATVSREFQLAVERRTFSALRVFPNEMWFFLKVFKRQHRQRCLSHIHLDIEPLPYCDDNKHMSRSDRRNRNNEIATDVIFELLQFLATWEQSCGIGLSLISRCHPLDFFCDEPLFQYDYLEILRPELLPHVDHIRSLSKTGMHRRWGDRDWLPSSLLTLATKFPRLETLDVRYAEPGEFLAFRHNIREDLINALDKMQLPSSISTFRFDIDVPDYTYHQPPNLMPHQEEEEHSLAIRRVIKNARKFEFIGQLDPSFFWPCASAMTLESFWQNMTDVCITLNAATPSGSWYIDYSPQNGHEAFPLHLKHQKPPEYGTLSETSSALAFLRTLDMQMDADARRIQREEHERLEYDSDEESDISERFCANPDTIVPFLEAVARAMSQMKSLQVLKLQDDARWIRWNSANSLRLEYCAPGRVGKKELARLPMDNPRVLLHARGLSLFHGQMVDLFRKVSIPSHDQEAVVKWI